MNRNEEIVQQRARGDYEEALRRAFWRKARSWLGRSCNDLLSTAEVFEYLKSQPRQHLGLQAVSLNRIIGSTGRAQDFDLAFYPRRKAYDERWINVAKARYRGVNLPPVVLFKVGEAYFVEDGNHRVSVARANGDKTIEARVIAFDTSTLTPKASCTRLGFKP